MTIKKETYKKLKEIYREFVDTICDDLGLMVYSTPDKIRSEFAKFLTTIRPEVDHHEKD